MNLKKYLIGAGISGLLLAGATINNEDLIKVSVINYNRGETIVMDTTFDASSGYTAEQFLTDNGLDPEKTRIINADAFDGKMILQNEKSVLFMRESGGAKFHVKEDVVIEQVRKVQIQTDENEDNSEVIIEEIKGDDIEDGEIVEVIIEELYESNEGDSDFSSEEKQDHVKIENINGNLKIYLNEEELEVEDLPENENISLIQLERIQKGLDNIQNNVSEHVIFEFKSKGEDPGKKIILQNGDTQEIIIGEEGVVMHRISPSIENIIGDFQHTIAIVSKVSEERGSSESFIAETAVLPIEGPSYFPNPSEGKFRLEFFLPERGQTLIQIYDMTGRMVYDENLGNFQGAYNDEINISNLESGHYIMNITQNNLRLAEKLIVN